MTWNKTFHRIWFDEPERPEFEAWREKLGELHPGWQIRTWGSSAEVRDMVEDPELLDLWDHYMEADPFGRIPDISRYLILWHFGGVYIDTDFECLRPFDELLADPRPFAAWENNQTMCTAILASPRRHPAIGVLLEGLNDRLKQTRGKPANEAVGPEYATQVWLERDDVRRLPPWTFFPVGWWEKELLGKIAYPERTYAVHHWSKGWAAEKAEKAEKAVAKPIDAPSISALMAFRDVDGSRTRLMEFIAERFKHHMPEVELCIASDDGIDPFHKTLALNRAAEKASGDLLMVTDCDTWLDPNIIREAARFVADNPKRWSKPWTFKLKMNQPATDAVLKQGLRWDGNADSRYGRPENRNAFSHAPPLIVTREQWRTVKGFDERFQGWGQEDVAFSLSLNRFYGAPKKFAGTCIHLYHNRIGRSGDDRWPGQASSRSNLMLVGEYRRARTAEQMRVLIDSRGDYERRSFDESVRDAANA